MNQKRTTVKIGWIIFMMIFFGFCALSGAQTNLPGKTTKVVPPPTIAPPLQNLPDLLVSDIQLVNGCQIQITVKNAGRGPVPDSGYDVANGVAIQMYKDGAAWGGIRLVGIDPAKKLQTPGAYVNHIWFPGAENLKLGPGWHSITVEVDNNHVVTELNESNNKTTKRLNCQGQTGPGGDLTVQIMQCPGVVKSGQDLGSGFQVVGQSTFASALNNVAVDIVLTSNPTYPAPVPYAVYSPNYSSGVLLKGGREHISFTGPGSLNVKLNGTNTIPIDTPPGYYYLGAVIDAGNKTAESNERNNVAFCRIKVEASQTLLPDLVVTGFAYTGSPAGQPPEARLLVEIRNQGPGAVPRGTGAKLDVYVNEALVASIDLDSGSVEQTAFHDVHNPYDPTDPGKSRSIVGTRYIFPSSTSSVSYNCRAVIDPANLIPETNNANNSFSRVEQIPPH
jgi:hypothetical protein